MAIESLASMLNFKRLPCLVFLTPAITACLLSVAVNTLAQDAKPPAQEQSAPVPSIEELKRQLEAKRLELKRQSEAKRQLEAKQQADAKQQAEAKQQADAKQQAEAKLQLEAKQQAEAKRQLEARQKQPKLPPAEREPATAPESPRTPASPAVLARSTPIPKNISPMKLEPNSAAVSDSCPYPAAARNRGETGTVVLLIYVTPDGHATDTNIESSSGSDVLDEAAASCVKEYGHFLPRRVGARAEAGWFRMKFKWSFGD
jgi:TonB family protein